VVDTPLHKPSRPTTIRPPIPEAAMIRPDLDKELMAAKKRLQQAAAALAPKHKGGELEEYPDSTSPDQSKKSVL
jgi:hypothetical protein